MYILIQSIISVLMKSKNRSTKVKSKKHMDHAEEGNVHRSSMPYRSLWDYGHLMMLQLSLKVAIQINIFNIIHKEGPEATLSAIEIADKIPATNPNSILLLQKLLHFLTVNSLLSSSLRQCNGDDKTHSHERTYGLTGLSRCMLTHDETSDMFSIAPIVMFGAEAIVFERLNMLKDAIVDPAPFFTQRVDLFDVASRNPSLNKSFNDLMAFWSGPAMKMVLDVYKGLEGVNELMDVGGGNGVVLQHIVSAYPHIRGINFDRPHVIANAPSYQGVEHIGGDMFDILPKAETIWMKAILHDWDDEKTLQILRNCFRALPERGKVILMEQVVPAETDRELTNDFSSIQVASEFVVMLMHQQGKERTSQQFSKLAKDGGFDDIKFFPLKNGLYIIELLKK